MTAASRRFGWYLAALQLFFTLCWALAGAALLYLAIARVKRWMAG